MSILRIPPGHLRVRLVEAQRAAGIGMLSAERVANTLHISIVELDAVLRALAAMGWAQMRVASGGRRVYSVSRLMEYTPQEGCRPGLSILPREVLTALKGVAEDMPVEVDIIAARLTAASGPVDPLWLDVALSVFVAAGHLLYREGRWHLTEFGLVAAYRAAMRPVQTAEFAAAFLAERQDLRGPIDWPTIAARLGVSVALVAQWADGAQRTGMVEHRDGHTYLTDSGRPLLVRASPLLG